jgi:hypothetical protein
MGGLKTLPTHSNPDKSKEFQEYDQFSTADIQYS